SALRNLNNDIQSDYLDPILDTFKKELGLDDEDIIRFPALFENASGCRGAGLTISLIPGTVNLIVTGDEPGETTKLFMPDPFLRGNGAAQSSDGLIQKTKELLPSEHELHFLDDWQTYHVAHGEVHCGTNVTRTPVTDWWSHARRLQEVQ